MLFKSELQKCKQHGSESVFEFYFRFTKLCQNAYLDTFQTALQEYFIDLFVSGLSNPEMKKHVYLKHPATLKECLSLSMEFEAFENCDVDQKAVSI